MQGLGKLKKNLSNLDCHFSCTGFANHKTSHAKASSFMILSTHYIDEHWNYISRNISALGSEEAYFNKFFTGIGMHPKNVRYKSIHNYITSFHGTSNLVNDIKTFNLK